MASSLGRLDGDGDGDGEAAKVISEEAAFSFGGVGGGTGGLGGLAISELGMDDAAAAAASG